MKQHPVLTIICHQVTPWYDGWWFYTLLLLFGAGLVWFHMRRRMRTSRREQARQLEMLREEFRLEAGELQAQMRPHFIFNALNSLQSYILNHDVDKAVFYLSILSKLIRRTLDNSHKKLVPLVEELEILKYYIEIEKMRFDGLFSYEISLEDGLPMESILVPPMLLQPFAEKAIRQGLFLRERKGLLQVHLKRTASSRVACVITDDGAGWQQKLYESYSTSDPEARGIQIIEDRQNILNELYRTDAYRFEVADTQDEHGSVTGTTAVIEYLYIEA
jgi:LytS/YehU family sensor histidine kinase